MKTFTRYIKESDEQTNMWQTVAAALKSVKPKRGDATGSTPADRAVWDKAKAVQWEEDCLAISRALWSKDKNFQLAKFTKACTTTDY